MAITGTAATVASLAISAASAVASGLASYQQARQQQKYNQAQAENYKKTIEANNRATAQEYADKMAAERVNQMQEKKKTAQQVQQVQREALEKSGTMMASTNAAGGALQYLLDDYTRQESQAKQSYRDQYQMMAESSEISIAAYQQKAQNQMDSQQGYSYMDSGNGLASALTTTALGIGKGVVGAYDTYQKWNPTSGDRIAINTSTSSSENISGYWNNRNWIS